MSKFLNTSEFIIMINSRHILNLSIELIIKPQALDKNSCYKCNDTKREAGREGLWCLSGFPENSFQKSFKRVLKSKKKFKKLDF